VRRSAAMARRKGRCSRGGRRKPTASIIPFQVLQVDARRFYHLAQHGLVQDPGAADPAEEGLGDGGERRRKGLGMVVRGSGGRAWGWTLEVGGGVGEWGGRGRQHRWGEYTVNLNIWAGLGLPSFNLFSFFLSYLVTIDTAATCCFLLWHRIF
jgi:hypothetical protein